MAWLVQHIGTILVGGVLAAVVAAITIKLVRDKQKGKCIGCDGGCGSCPHSPHGSE